ncbi:hypothetical protein B0J13DRAFT_529625 [Dactylonectria estremocensis]|uniref:Uncharacterized protein n=1 Tax=Dactylonectria estremocensis TaxID=1079267 RepID=A0A9P9E6F7_9HYPO|nr:hypothetical protein B0J13DRAFT_529625 [Dactylonectria estremocensis]
MLFGLALAALIPTGQPLTVFDTPSGGGLSDSYADNPVYTVREDMNVIWNTDLDNTDFYVFLRCDFNVTVSPSVASTESTSTVAASVESTKTAVTLPVTSTVSTSTTVAAVETTETALPIATVAGIARRGLHTWINSDARCFGFPILETLSSEKEIRLGSHTANTTLSFSTRSTS